MSRIRGIVQKDVLQTRKYGLNEIINKKNEDQSANSKDDVEKYQIKELLHKLPRLDKIFEVHRKIGEGTFSSVYLGSLRQHATLPDSEKRWFAIKHLVPTAHPARIEHELRCLQDMGGKHHVIGVELCLRNLDTIVFIMPYIPHRKFSEYVGDMDAAELRQYMRALLTALRHVHSFGVIHRDVKPSNFLYDRDNKRYLLVDFGLAQRLCPAPEEPAAAPAPALPALPAPPPAHSNGLRKRTREEEDASAAKRLALDLSTGGPVAVAAPPAAAHAAPPPRAPAPRCALGASPPAAHAQPAPGAAPGAARCLCAGAAGVCGACLARAPPRAPRAGTQGFRPPEVLLKYPHQTTAVDVWAAGVVLASALTARYPFFRAADDVAALAELADLLGTAPLQRAAEALGRRVVTSAARRGLCLRKLAARLRGPAPGLHGTAPGLHGTAPGLHGTAPGLHGTAPGLHGTAPGLHGTAPGLHGTAPAVGGACAACARCRLLRDQCLCRDEMKKAEEWSPSRWVAGFPDAAFGLAARLLEPDPRARPSAHDALQHPFLAD